MKTLEFIQSKIFNFNDEKSISDFLRKLAYWNFTDKKIVFTNGCFDIIHLGHIDYLSKASDLGKVLIIGLNTDLSISKIKGKGRPVNDENSRANALAAFGFVDAVILFNEETPYELIKLINPDVLVKGNDYKAEEIVGYDIIKAKGGEIITIDFLEGYSTTSIINKIKSL